MGTGLFPEAKWHGLGVEHPLPSNAEVKERVELYLYSSSGELKIFIVVVVIIIIIIIL
jgi:hypothetical protein